MQVRDLVKHFPIHAGFFRKQVGAVQAVDGVSFDVLRGETLGIVGESRLRQVDDRTAAAAADGADRRARSSSRASEIAHIKGAELKALRREMQMIFQDPYSSLNPRKTVGSIISDPFVIHGMHKERGRAQAGGPGADGHRRPEPRALQPLPARVLGRPAPAHRRRPRARAQAEADHRRRAGLRARRVDPGAGAQPAARPAARARADADLHRPRPLGRAPHVRPRRGHVPRPDRRAGDVATSSTRTRGCPTRAR